MAVSTDWLLLRRCFFARCCTQRPIVVLLDSPRLPPPLDALDTCLAIMARPSMDALLRRLVLLCAAEGGAARGATLPVLQVRQAGWRAGAGMPGHGHAALLGQFTKHAPIWHGVACLHAGHLRCVGR